MVFVVHGKPFRAHRCVLGARSTYFANMLDTKWKGKSTVVLRHPLVRLSRGQREAGVLCGVAASDLPLAVSAHRSILWPLGPCCSTCTQVTLQAQMGKLGGGHISVQVPLGWVGLGDSELVCLLWKSLYPQQTEPLSICLGACRTEDGETRAACGPGSPGPVAKWLGRRPPLMELCLGRAEGPSWA